MSDREIQRIVIKGDLKPPSRVRDGTVLQARETIVLGKSTYLDVEVVTFGDAKLSEVLQGRKIVVSLVETGLSDTEQAKRISDNAWNRMQRARLDDFS